MSYHCLYRAASLRTRASETPRKDDRPRPFPPIGARIIVSTTLRASSGQVPAIMGTDSAPSVAPDSPGNENINRDFGHRVDRIGRRILQHRVITSRPGRALFFLSDTNWRRAREWREQGAETATSSVSEYRSRSAIDIFGAGASLRPFFRAPIFVIIIGERQQRRAVV